MVGVGGRSKACSNCRRRHIKCDETKPQCYRCCKAKLKCGGYPHLTIIQYGQPAAKKDLAGFRDTSEKITTLASNPKQQNTIQAQSGEFLHNRWISVPQDDVFMSYTLAHLLSGEGREAVFVTGIGRNLTEKCFLALSTTYFGVEHGEQSLIRRGLQRYGHALNQLNQALGDVFGHRSFDVMDAVTVMTMFEFLLSEDKHAWISHARGLESLLELYGPDSFSSHPALLTLERARLPIISAALVLRRPTILTLPQWKSAPWSRSPGRKSLLQYLLDILSDCPNLFATKDKLDTGMARKDLSSELRLVSEKAHDLLQQLEEWKQDWNTHHPECSYEYTSPATTPSFTTEQGQVLPIWSTVLQYQSVYHASAESLYNATRILLLKYIQDTVILGCESEENDQYISENMFAAGIMICRNVEYHMSCIRKGAGSFFLLFPLRMAFDAVGPYNTEIRTWLKGVLHSISSGSVGRWAAAKHVLEMRAPNTG